MSPSVPALPLRAGSSRQSACLLAPPLFHCRGQPALVVFDGDLAECAQRAALHEVAGLAHHRVAGVVVGDTEHGARLLHGGHQFVGLRAGVHQRLVAHHVEARLHKRQRHDAGWQIKS